MRMTDLTMPSQGLYLLEPVNNQTTSGSSVNLLRKKKVTNQHLKTECIFKDNTSF